MKHGEHGHHIASRASWIRRIGAAGFLFFLIKGILWLVMLAGAWHLSF